MPKKAQNVAFSTPIASSPPGADPTDPVGGVAPEPMSGPLPAPIMPKKAPFDPMDLMDKVEHMVLKMDQTDAKLQAVANENQQLRNDALDAKKEADNHIFLLQDQVDVLLAHETPPKDTRRSSSYGGKLYQEPPPKVLTSGNEFDDMPKFANHRSRDILKHLADFRDKSENYEKGY